MSLKKTDPDLPLSPLQTRARLFGFADPYAEKPGSLERRRRLLSDRVDGQRSSHFATRAEGSPTLREFMNSALVVS